MREFSTFGLIYGLPWWPRGKESNCQYRRCGFDTWVEKIPGEGNDPPAPVLFPVKSCGQRSLVGYSAWGRRRLRHNLGT